MIAALHGFLGSLLDRMVGVSWSGHMIADIMILAADRLLIRWS
jgi:hypothetical protein